MGIAYNTSIVRDGLVLHLDAANVKSYPGSGTDWNDLSNSKYTSTLYNGPLYSNINLGRIDVDGSNDYIEVNEQALNFQPTDPFSVFVFQETISYPGDHAIVSNMKSSSPYPGYDIWVNSSTELAVHIVSSWFSNAIKVSVTFNWSANAGLNTYLGFTYDGSSPTNSTDEINSIDFYVNGELNDTNKGRPSSTGQFNTTSETISYPSNQRFRIGGRFASGSKAQGDQAKIYSVQVYNKKLTPQEIQQNFEALRGRYGI